MPVDPIIDCVELGRIDYRSALKLQHRLVAARLEGQLQHDLLLLLEHPPVFTLGRRGGKDHLCVTEAFLKQKSVDLVHVERGGDITYHGPGQLVGYPIINLRRRKLTVTEYVTALETIMQKTAQDWGVELTRDDRNRGVWLGDSKMGSIGIALRKGVTFHGFAFNVNLDLEPFQWINPCGLEGVGIARLKDHAQTTTPMDHVRKALKKHFSSVLNARLTSHDSDILGHYSPFNWRSYTAKIR